MRLAALVSLTLMLHVLPLSAQSRRGTPSDPNDPRSPAPAVLCDTAIGEVNRLAARPHRPDLAERHWLWTAARCGARGGAALARLVPLARTTRDIAMLRDAETIASDLLDASIARAMLRLAADTGATAESRIFAFRVLMRMQVSATWVDLSSSYTATGTSCRTHTIAPLEPLPGAPLPSDFAHRAGTLAVSVMRSPASANVRAMAECAYRHVRPFATLEDPAARTWHTSDACLPVTPLATSLRDQLAADASDSSAAGDSARALYHLPRASHRDVEQILHENLCAKAIVTIRRWRDDGQGPARVYLFRIGSVYVATGQSGTAYEGAVWVLDRSLTKFLGGVLQ